MPVGVAVTLPIAAVVLFAGVAIPMSTESSTPLGKAALFNRNAVTTARPRLFVPRSWSMAIAIGSVSTAIVVTGVAVVVDKDARFGWDSVFEPVFATSA